MLTWSLTEFEATARKALRGAGHDWGLAEDGARAARILAEQGLTGADILLRYLQAGAAICPIRAGAALSDAPRTTPFDLPDCAEPLLLAPFLMATIAPGEGLEMTLGATSVRVSRDTIALSGPVPPVSAVRIAAAPPPSPGTRKSRAYLSEDTADALLAFAHRTYAPATEASRLAGAGAGLSDND